MDVLITKGFHCIQLKTTHKSLEDSQSVCSFRHCTTFTLYHPFIHLSGERHFGRKVSCPRAWQKHLAKALTQDLSINAKSALGIRPTRLPTAETLMSYPDLSYGKRHTHWIEEQGANLKKFIGHQHWFIINFVKFYTLDFMLLK